MLKKEIHETDTELEIRKAHPENYNQIMEVWESSVKASHYFLRPHDFEYYKKIIPTDYLPNLNVYILCSAKQISGFIGVSGEDLEMLFIAGDLRGKGYGKKLLNYAIQNLNIKKVDVNEQNQQAIGFYGKFSFKIIGRSPKDGAGKDYPILHLSL